MRRASGVLLVLLSTSVLATDVSAQEDPTRPRQRSGDFSLEQNYPNPFNPETRIPFVLGGDLFEDGRGALVSMRIFNVLQQFVAAPTALRHAAGEGVSVIQLEYQQPGRYEAYWDGRDQNGHLVASGVYWVQLTVNGASKARRMFVQK